MFRKCSLMIVVAGSLSIVPFGKCQEDKQISEESSSLIDEEGFLTSWQGGTVIIPHTKITTEQQSEWNKEVFQHWSVVEDELVHDGIGPHLVSKKHYANFELWADLLISPQGRCGIYLRGYPQVVFRDIAILQDSAIKSPGGLVNKNECIHFPTSVAVNSVGEWNRIFIRVVGEYVTVVLNDKVIVEDIVMDNYFDLESPIGLSGPLHLESQGGMTRFRNLFIREISYTEAVERIMEIHGGEEGFETIFNGENLVGWIGATSAYEVFERTIRCKKGHIGNLLTQEKFEDFILRLEMLIPPRANNGIGIHVPSVDAIPAFDGMEIQVIDATTLTNLKDYQQHGSIYGIFPAHQGYLRPPGQWNFQEVVVNKGVIEVHLNGFEILHCKLEDVRHEPMDGEEHPGAFQTIGHVGFCGHQDAVQFRNIRIKRIQ